MELLEDRVVPSWAGVPPTSVSPASLAAAAVFQNGQGDAAGSSSIVSNEVDYRTFTALTSGAHRFTASALDGGGLDTVLGVFNSSGTRLAYNDDIVTYFNTDSALTVNLTAGQRYYFGVTNYTGSAGGSYSWGLDGPALSDDGYEQNDSLAQAYNLGTLTARKTVSGLRMADGEDWYQFTTRGYAGTSHYVRINFSNSKGDLDLYLYDAAGNQLAISNGTGNSETIGLGGLVPGTYFVRVRGFQDIANPSYSLDILPPAALADDSYENNDSFALAKNLGTLSAVKTISNLKMADSQDWYKFTMNKPGTATNYVSINFQHARGDLELALYDAAGSRLALSNGGSDSERISLDGLGAGTYFVQVYGYQGAFSPSYSLQVSPGSGSGSGTPAGGFHIDLTFSGLTASQQAIFNQAAARWEQIIIGDLPNATYNGYTIDDVWIEARVISIDGAYGTLGRAGPDRLRSNALPYHGVMEFDSADVNRLEADGGLLYTIQHEMGHVLGIGTIWSTLGLLTGAGTSNPRFTGSQATAAYNSIFGVAATGVPLENSMGQGSDDSHWREALFGRELMSPQLNAGVNPLSRVTVASLADLGYQVNMNAADAYTPSGSNLTSLTSGGGSGARLVAATPDNDGAPVQGFNLVSLLPGSSSADGLHTPAPDTPKSAVTPAVGLTPAASRRTEALEFVANRLHSLNNPEALQVLDALFANANLWAW